MADIKISQLGSAITVDDSDIVPVVSGGNTLKATAAQLKEHAIGNTSISGIGDGSVTGAISALNSDKQPKTLATPITVDDTPQTTVEGALGAINTDLETTKQALTKNAIVLGDSYASGTGSPDGYGIFHFLEPYFDNAYLFSGSGTGFTDYDGNHTNDTYIKHLTDAINSALFDNADITDIIILGAYGDSRQYIQSNRRVSQFGTAIASAVSSFASSARSNFTNLKRIIYVDCESRANNTITSGGYTSYFSDSINADNALEYYLNLAGIVNLGSVGGYIAFKSDYFASDNYHCNTYGYEYLANAIIRLLEKNKNTVFLQTVNNISIDISSVTGITGSTITGKCYLENNIPKLRLLFSNIKAGTFTPVTSYTKLPITNADYMGVIDEVGRNVTVVALPVDGTIYNLNIRTYADSTGQGIEVKFNESTSKSVASDVVCAVSVEF